MKNHISYVAVFAIMLMDALSVACSKKIEPDDPDVSIMTIVRQGDPYCSIRLAGSGTATIDWGDGTAIETHKLWTYKASDWEAPVKYRYPHPYLGDFIRTIKITGENITHLECGQIKNLDVSENTGLSYLRCGSKELRSLDVSKNTQLEFLDCSGSQLTSLDVNNNTVLNTLFCHNNQITNLNLSNNTELTILNCFNNRLTNLDVSKNTALTNLEYGKNLIENLDVSNNVALIHLACLANNMSSEALNTLFGTLHDNTGYKTLSIGDNPGTGACDQSIAKGKGWTVYTYSYTYSTF